MSGQPPLPNRWTVTCHVLSRLSLKHHPTHSLASHSSLLVGFNTTFMATLGSDSLLNQTPSVASVGKRNKQPILIPCGTTGFLF